MPQKNIKYAFALVHANAQRQFEEVKTADSQLSAQSDANGVSSFHHRKFQDHGDSDIDRIVFSGFSTEIPNETQRKLPLSYANTGGGQLPFPEPQCCSMHLYYMVFWVKCNYTPLW